MSDERRVAVIVEDDADVRQLLDTVLTRSGFETHLAENGEQGVELVREHRPTLTTLDVNMPGMDGFAAAKAIRAFSDSYIIMLTGLGDEIDVVSGLESGADDYIVKPFRTRELRARIDSIMRRPRRGPASLSVIDGGRQQAPEGAILPGPDGSLAWRGLLVRPVSRSVSVDGRAIEVSRGEFDLLAAVLATGRDVRSRTELVEVLRQHEPSRFFVNGERAVEVTMTNVLRKLGESSTQPRWIEIVGTTGYRLVPS